MPHLPNERRALETAQKEQSVAPTWANVVSLLVVLAVPIAIVIALYVHLVVRAALWGWGLS